MTFTRFFEFMTPNLLKPL